MEPSWDITLTGNSMAGMIDLKLVWPMIYARNRHRERYINLFLCPAFCVFTSPWKVSKQVIAKVGVVINRVACL